MFSFIFTRVNVKHGRYFFTTMASLWQLEVAVGINAVLSGVYEDAGNNVFRVRTCEYFIDLPPWGMGDTWSEGKAERSTYDISLTSVCQALREALGQQGIY